MQRLRAWAWLWIPLALALVLRAVFFVGTVAADDLHYGARAASIVDGRHTLGAEQQSLRFGLTVPTAACLALFGRSLVSLNLFMLLCSLGSVALACAFGRRLAGDRGGLAAGLALAVTPLAVTSASRIAPEPAAGMLLGAAMLLFLKAHDEGGTRALVVAAAAGVALGFSHLVKETAFLLWVALAVEAAVRRQWRPLAAAAAGFAAVALVEGLVYLAVTGDFFYRFHCVRAAHFAGLDRYVTGGDVAWHAPLVMLAQKRYTLGIHAAALLAAGIAMIARRDLGAAPFLRWCGLLFLLTAFWPARFSPYLRAIPVDVHYYEPLLLPSAVAIGLAASWLRGRRLAATAVPAALLVLACNVVVHQHARIRASVAVETYQHLMERPSVPVVADADMEEVYRFLSGFRDRLVIANVPRPEWREFLLVRRDGDMEVTAREAREAWNRRADEWLADFASRETFASYERRSINLRHVIRLQAPARGDVAARVYHCARR